MLPPSLADGTSSGAAELTGAADPEAAAERASTSAAELAIAASIPVPGTDEVSQAKGTENVAASSTVAVQDGVVGGKPLTVDVRSPPRIQPTMIQECETPSNTALVQSIQNGQSTPNSKRNQVEDQKEDSRVDGENPKPTGIPQSFGPSATPMQQNFTGSLFTPEQLETLEASQRQAPFLTSQQRPSLLSGMGLSLAGLVGRGID